MINTILNTGWQEQLKEQLWRDDLAKMPRHLYPEWSEVRLQELWQREYRSSLTIDPATMTELLSLFAPAPLAELRPRYLADSGGRWYALITPRYNRRTKYRFCYVRYWWAADRAALQALVRAALAAWQAVPFDWLKLRMGFGSTFQPIDIHPRAVRQNYVVAGRLNRQQLQQKLPRLKLGSLLVRQPRLVTPAWWLQYRALLDEQERLSPGLEDWNNYELALLELEQEMKDILQYGGGVVNLFENQQLIGHISWEPDSYREQLIGHCWHINQIIVKASHRRQGLGEALHHLAAARMNLRVTPIVAGLISAGNEASLKTAAKMGRQIVDSYVIVPKP